MTVAVVAGYLASAVLAYGIVFATFTKPHGDVQGGVVFGLLMAPFGPFALVVLALLAVVDRDHRNGIAFTYSGKRLKW